MLAIERARMEGSSRAATNPGFASKFGTPQPQRIRGLRLHDSLGRRTAFQSA